MPDISITDNLGFNFDVEPTDASAFAKYFGSAAKFVSSDGKLGQLAPLSLASDGFTSLQTGLSVDRPIAISSDEFSLSLKAGATASIKVFVPDPHLDPGEADSLFETDHYGENVAVKQAERYVSVELATNAGPVLSTTLSNVLLGFAADSSLTLTNYQKFSIQPEAPTLLDAIKTTFASFQIPASLADLAAMRLDSVVTVAGSGDLKFSASTNLLAISNPLATAELPAALGTISVSEGASFRVGGSFRLFGDYEVRVRKTGENTVRVGYFKQRGKEWKTGVSAAAGVSLSLGDDDLFARVISALSPDAEADFKELKQAGIDPATTASIQATVQAAIERTLEIATSYEVGSLSASQSAFLYEVDLSALDTAGENAIRTALRGDLSALVGNEESLPRGIKMLQSIFTNLRQNKRTFKVNLLGIYNFISVSKLTVKGKALYDPETGELILSDSATATTLQASVVNVGGKPNQADPKQVRKILASSLLVTAAYRASDLVTTPPSLKSSHVFCEVHERTDRETMADELGVAVGLRLMTRPELNELIQSSSDFGRTIVYASADYSDSLATTLFLENGEPRQVSEYENIGRQAMQVVAMRGGAGDPVRSRPLQDDDLWKKMKDQG
ncbi:MAG: hypothetical protein ACJ74Y_06375, partial [Bryobacteraceae bacterium]